MVIGGVEFFGQISEKCSYRAQEFVKVLTLKRKKALEIIHSGSFEDIVAISSTSIHSDWLSFKRNRRNFTVLKTTSFC